jgi:hypothetical protein
MRISLCERFFSQKTDRETDREREREREREDIFSKVVFLPFGTKGIINSIHLSFTPTLHEKKEKDLFFILPLHFFLSHHARSNRRERSALSYSRRDSVRVRVREGHKKSF